MLDWMFDAIVLAVGLVIFYAWAHRFKPEEVGAVKLVLIVVSAGLIGYGSVGLVVTAIKFILGRIPI